MVEGTITRRAYLHDRTWFLMVRIFWLLLYRCRIKRRHLEGEHVVRRRSTAVTLALFERQAVGSEK